MARRDDREYREYLREEQRRQSGCPARDALLIQLRQATSFSAGFDTKPGRLRRLSRLIRLCRRHANHARPFFRNTVLSPSDQAGDHDCVTPIP
jgi:hypothetical protein